ncbi:hypothetical protein [Clostridium botulinum]|uniref:hypothetical protein n=1 Tax=Clostridium botulinum TaxID=1491 RepID=UPI0007741116|nr:hypothetical protein [Clostridium botulinum]NFL40090.1 hypothetical protein [Clostridium botulinum]NFL67178.1 hypothetical protein [Clostridium botulinum]NFN09965.1 hypothetical protein [Clostridium botulinum]NFN33492.1 hypothetical protein [Clostridium botulinum]
MQIKKANKVIKIYKIKNKKLKKMLKKKKYYIYKKTNFPILFRLIGWIIKDIIKKFKTRYEEKRIHIYGIYGYFGLPGKGKTMALAELGLRYREKYKDKIYIVDNFGFKYSNWHFDSANWKELLIEQDKPVLYLFDEIQNIFNSRDFKSFPTELLTLLTQNRKGNGKMICYTAQRWGRVDKVFRELTFKCYECKTIFGRLTKAKGYNWEDYEMLLSTTDIKKKMKIHPITHTFIQTDQIRNSYNSYQMLQIAKDKMYLDRTEIASLR